MGQRSRKRRSGATARTAPPAPDAKPAADAAMKRGYARGEARNEAIRAELEPLKPGERPRAVTVAAILAALVAVANVVATVLSDPTPAEWRFAVIQVAVLVAAAVGMWFAKYWAVLGFQALLALSMVVAFLSLLRASNLAAVVYCVVIIAACAPMFWFLVRAMARIQMPERPTREAS